MPKGNEFNLVDQIVRGSMKPDDLSPVVAALPRPPVERHEEPPPPPPPPVAPRKINQSSIGVIIGVALLSGSILWKLFGFVGLAALGGLFALVSIRPIRSQLLRPRRRLLVVLVVIAGLEAAGLMIRVDRAVTGTVALVPAETRDVCAEAASVIKQVHVRQGDVVVKGQLLVTLDWRHAETELAARKAALRKAQVEVEMARRGAGPQERARAEAAVEVARLNFKNTDETLKRFEAVRDLVARKDLESARHRQTMAAKKLEVAQREFDLINAGGSAEDVARAESRVEALQVEVLRAEEMLARSELRAPVDGVVATEGLEQEVSHRVEPGQLVVRLYSSDPSTARIVVSDSELKEIPLHHPVTFKISGFPNRTFEGQVQELSSAAGSGSDRLEIRSDIRDVEGVLKPGMSGTARILIDRPTLLEFLIQRLLR